MLLQGRHLQAQAEAKKKDLHDVSLLKLNSSTVQTLQMNRGLGGMSCPVRLFPTPAINSIISTTINTLFQLTQVVVHVETSLCVAPFASTSPAGFRRYEICKQSRYSDGTDTSRPCRWSPVCHHPCSAEWPRLWRCPKCSVEMLEIPAVPFGSPSSPKSLRAAAGTALP